MKQTGSTANSIHSKPRVAIVGAGIAGLSSAYHLHQDFDVTVFEKNDYLGGHTDTHCLEIDGQQVRVDSGFIIFCPEYYPHFCAMLSDLNIESQATNMSFAARNRTRGVLYNATTLNRLFCERKNLLKISFWRMLKDIVRFYHQAPKVLESQHKESLSVKQYLAEHGYSNEFSQDHLLPMISALWSATPQRVEQFPVLHLVDFFQRHGLMKLIGRPQWRVLKNGSATYVQALRETLNCAWVIGDGVREIRRDAEGISITTEQGKQQRFDALVMATHADTSLELLADASQTESDILSAIPFEKNHVVVHTDESIMPGNKLAWASWNVDVPYAENANSLACCTANYWMNLLQSLPINTNVFTSLNCIEAVDREQVLAERYYYHPVFTADSVAAQKRLPEINGEQSTYHAGAFWGWGFHEDGARSAWQACQLLRAQFAQSDRAYQPGEVAA